MYDALFVCAMAAFSRVSGLCVNLNSGADSTCGITYEYSSVSHYKHTSHCAGFAVFVLVCSISHQLASFFSALWGRCNPADGRTFHDAFCCGFIFPHTQVIEPSWTTRFDALVPSPRLLLVILKQWILLHIIFVDGQSHDKEGI